MVDDEEEEFTENLYLVATTPESPLMLQSNTAAIVIGDDDRVVVQPPSVSVYVDTLSMGTGSPSRNQTVRVGGLNLTESSISASIANRHGLK